MRRDRAPADDSGVACSRSQRKLLKAPPPLPPVGGTLGCLEKEHPEPVVETRGPSAIFRAGPAFRGPAVFWGFSAAFPCCRFTWSQSEEV